MAQFELLDGGFCQLGVPEGQVARGVVQPFHPHEVALEVLSDHPCGHEVHPVEVQGVFPNCDSLTEIRMLFLVEVALAADLAARIELLPSQLD